MTEQKSRLVVEISSEQAKRNAELLNQELDKLYEKGNKSSVSSAALSKELKTTGESAKSLGESTSKTTKDLAQQESQLNKNGSAVMQLAKYVAGYLTISKAISMADGYTQMAARIRNATTSTQEYNLVQDRLLSTANTTFRALSEAQEVYLSMSGGMKSLGYSISETLDMTDSLSFAFTANATRADQAQSAMDALSKSMAKGKVDADAWISIVTGADNVIADMAKTTGRSESEIRQLGATGKISLTELIKTLIQTKDANEALANNMENSFADGMQKLSNAVTVYLGKTNESTSATGMLAAALGTLADNLDTVSNVAILGGVAYLTKVIATQTLAVRASILASINKRNATIAELESQVRLSAVEVQRTRQVTALAATELQLARVEYNAALTRNERAAATIRLTQAEIAHNLAMKQTTIATTAQTAAQNALNTSQAIGSRLFNLVGGGVGVLTIGVAALAAGYMYMQNRAAEANKKLEEQASVAKKAKEELLALKGLEKDDAIDKMTASFKLQNEALAESSTQINIQLTAIKRLYAGNKDIVQVVEDAQNGTISMTDAVKKFNELRINKDVYNSFKAHSTEFVKNATEAKNTKEKLNLLGFEFELTGRKAQTSVVGIDANSKSFTENEKAVKSAAQAQKDYRESLYDREFDAVFTRQLLAKNLTEEQIKVLLEAAKWARKNNVKFTNELAQEALRVHAIEQKNNKTIEDRNKLLKATTDELAKQQKVLQVNAKVQALSAKHNISTKAAAAGIPNGLIEAIIMQESKGDKNAVGPVTKNGQRARGLAQFMPATAKQYGVNVFDEESSINGMIKYMSALIRQFEGDIDKAIMAYNAGPANVQTGKAYGFKETKDYLANVKAYTAGVNGYAGSSKDFDDVLKAAEKTLEEQAQSRKVIELEVADEITKIRENLKDKILEIDRAGFTPENALKLKEEFQRRADNDIAIAEYALKTKLDDYADFQKSEAELLEKSFAQKKFAASRDLELTKEERDEAVVLLNQQLLQEKGLLELAKAQRLFQIRAQSMSEIQALEERYKFEEDKIALIDNIEERNYERQMLRLEKQAEIERLLIDSSAQWGQMEAEMRGTTGYMQIEQTRRSRSGTSERLYNASVANINMNEQSTLGGAQTQLDDGLISIQEFEDRKTAIIQTALDDRKKMHDEYANRQVDIEQAYQQETLNLQLTQAQQLTGSFANMFGGILGESSNAYRTMYAMQQGFAITQAGINMWTSASEAYAKSTSPTIWGRMADAGKAILDQGTFLAMIQSITPRGFSDGGFTGLGGKFDPAGIVHKGEVVWSQDDIKRWGGVNVVEAMRTSRPSGYSDGGLVSTKDTRRVGSGVADAVKSGDESFALKVIINNAPEGTTAERGADGNLYVTIPQVKQMIKESWGNLGQAGSFESKQVSRNFDTRKRLG
ncbi:hypothetical protein B9T31_17575 [Acinetobacter sp. ANC 4558]|uniref:tape measure protein n=1 Tax=Acinetobacter sp. ANC 4558 TaxID=1977876 RepID=UPI000A332112|nr:tape measure protein [Acinetobacter sp. ANC 4558]OTG78498.1 hypothetical protein B9T31_17575 [Acinetobacter sp. ANC 4558]